VKSGGHKSALRVCRSLCGIRFGCGYVATKFGIRKRVSDMFAIDKFGSFFRGIPR